MTKQEGRERCVSCFLFCLRWFLARNFLWSEGNCAHSPKVAHTFLLMLKVVRDSGKKINMFFRTWILTEEETK